MLFSMNFKNFHNICKNHTKTKNMQKYIITFLILLMSNFSLAQISSPQASPRSKIFQKVGLVDISIDYSDAEKLDKLRWRFYFMGYRLTCKKVKDSFGPIKQDDYRIFKLKPLGYSFLKIFPLV